jgi:hypothetical protein
VSRCAPCHSLSLLFNIVCKPSFCIEEREKRPEWLFCPRWRLYKATLGESWHPCAPRAAGPAPAGDTSRRALRGGRPASSLLHCAASFDRCRFDPPFESPYVCLDAAAPACFVNPRQRTCPQLPCAYCTCTVLCKA